jgi:hypothetical protein
VTKLTHRPFAAALGSLATTTREPVPAPHLGSDRKLRRAGRFTRATTATAGLDEVGLLLAQQRGLLK